MGAFTLRSFVRHTPAFLPLIILAGCAKTDSKEFRPIVAKIGAEVRAISTEEARSVCLENYCEDNQIYVTHFGRRKPTPDPTPAPTPTQPGPGPTNPPNPDPSQPPEQLDYSRAVLNAAEAWKITEGSAEVIVAVIDSGVDYFHPDLRNNIAVNAAEKNGRSGVDDDGNGYIDDVYGYDFFNDRANGYDDNGHGTHCAGIIAAEKNAIGVRGIAPRVKILPIKFLGKNGSGDTADAIRAIDYAVSRGARILSNSWGGGGASQLLDDAIQRAINQGAIFVAAAGNSAMDNDETENYPANYPNVISIGSSDSRDARSSFSNYGNKTVKLFAPGSAILSTYPNGQYRSLSGTSMATPQVSGAIALALSLEPNLSRANVTSDLCNSSVQKLLGDSECGRMDVAAFVRRVQAR